MNKIRIHLLMRDFLLAVFIFLCTLVSKAQTRKEFQYTGKYLQNLQVPIGGISTGNILMGGRGNIAHIEVFNRPDRQRSPINTFFALYTKVDGQKPICKILEREYLPPYNEESHLKASGLPRMKEAIFTNAFPLAQWQFIDAQLPLVLSLEVFNPFIPLNVDDSSFPVVNYSWKLKNNDTERVEATLMLNIENPIKAKKISNNFHQNGTLTGIKFAAIEGADVNYQGNFIAMVNAPETTVQTHLYPGRWRDDMHILWEDFSRDGKIESITESWETTYKPTSYNEISNRNSVILVEVKLEPGEEIIIPFYLAWHFPDRVFKDSETFGTDGRGKVFSNYYKKLFTDETFALETFVKKQNTLYALTKSFSESLNSSSYSTKIIESLSTQAASIKTNLIQVTDRGEVHGFEGVLDAGWCCPGTCTHVWNYEQTLASLFPSLERNMREIEFLYDVDEKGMQNHRSVFPLGDYRFDGGAAADGQMGSITRVYREWKNSGDNEWLAKLWPKVKLALEYAWNTHWDPDKDGIMEGRQHNTYDISFFGPSSMTTSCYLAALKASAQMAEAMGESDKAKDYLSVYHRGVKKMEELLWNGEYFIQIIPLDEKGNIKDDFELSPPNKNGEQLPKYQYGDGCLADQLLGQYIAQNAGLGFILDKSKTRLALKAVYDYNFIKKMSDYENVQRIYALNDDAGVVLCSWPHDNQPVLPFVYAQEVWSGVEYAVASSLIHAGMVKEGIEIVEAVQDRHDGFKRNPFMHNESGVHYARAMASWSVLLALSGFEYDGMAKKMSFSPKLSLQDFSTFWSCGTAWGTFTIQGKIATISVKYGELALNEFGLGEGLALKKGPDYRIKDTEEDISKALFKKELKLEAGGRYAFELIHE